MYNEIWGDLRERFPVKSTQQAPLWGAAIQALLKQKFKEVEPPPVTWLARKTGIHQKHLYNIIAGRVKDPSSEKLVKIACALEVSFPELAGRAMSKDADNFVILTHADRASIEYSQHGFSIESFGPAARNERDFFWGRMTIRPNQTLRLWQFHENSMVRLFVETGLLEIKYGDTMKVLRTNEAAHFDACVPHRLRNIDSNEAKLLIATSPALY